ncbi:MAG: M1 family metallopeptidase [Anaerolineales bacterium]|nr:M1 family metallopeptidase [Anaerolineales bacterium]
MNSLTKLLLYYFYPHPVPRNNNFWVQRFLVACLLACGLAACSLPYTGPPPLTPEATAATQPVSTAAALTPTPAYTAPDTFTPSQYRLVATLDFAAHYLAVSQNITYTNNSAHALELIPIVVPVSEELLTLTSLRYDRGLEWGSHVDASGGLIELFLARPLLPGDELQVELEFAIAIPERPVLLGWSARQMTLIDWYPFIPPYDDDAGWLVNEPTQQGEYLVYESADFDVSIYTVNAPALLQIAAPAPAEQRDRAYHYQLHGARRFVWAASGHYQAETQLAGEQRIPVTIYYFEEERAAAQAALRTAVASLELYENLFGPYPYESLAIVECIFPDGMESDGIFFLDMGYFRRYDGTPRNLLTMLTAHEVAHSWWFGAVGNDAGQEPWLDEAMATYAELLYYEQAHPFDLDWWWEFRIEQWQPDGAVDSTAYELPNFRPYVNAVYLRGAQFLHAVRQQVGDQAFYTFLKDYYAAYDQQVAHTAGFFALLQQSTGQDLSEIIGEYFANLE